MFQKSKNFAQLSLNLEKLLADKILLTVSQEHCSVINCHLTVLGNYQTVLDPARNCQNIYTCILHTKIVQSFNYNSTKV